MAESESHSDITLMLTGADGNEWGKFISDRLNTFPKVTHSTLVLDEQEYENPPEVTYACRQSTVLLLLATPELAEFLKLKAGWFAPALLELPPTSCVVVVMLMDRKDVDQATNDRYSTGEWKYFDAGHTVEEVERTIAHVLDIVDTCQAARKEKKEEEVKTPLQRKSPLPPTPDKPRASPKAHVDFYPSTVYEVCCIVLAVICFVINYPLSSKGQ